MDNEPQKPVGATGLSETLDILLVEDNPEDALLIWA
jgi:hypothetical protein